jgi:hypothetical protein
MLQKFGLAFALILAAAAPAMAQSACSAPIPPAAIDGSTATKAQIVAASHDANNFMKAADDYQECVSLEYDKAVTDAKNAKKDVDPSLTQAADTNIKSSQALKVRVGAEFNASYAAYKKAHPGG